jgi:hypothetical protein
MQRLSKIASKKALMLPLQQQLRHEQNSSSKWRGNVRATLSRIGNDLSELLELNILQL